MCVCVACMRRVAPVAYGAVTDQRHGVLVLPSACPQLPRCAVIVVLCAQCPRPQLTVTANRRQSQRWRPGGRGPFARVVVTTRRRCRRLRVPLPARRTVVEAMCVTRAAACHLIFFLPRTVIAGVGRGVDRTLRLGIVVLSDGWCVMAWLAGCTRVVPW